ncbi:MAG: DUF1566 domain-containing protein [Deltaproteobacteria bacterium]
MTSLLLILSSFFVLHSSFSFAAIPTAPLSQTGQTICYSDSGASIPCSGTGQDGEMKVGAKWPSPRFLDNSIAAPADLTITDNLTGLIWTKDANLAAGTKTWQLALDYVKSLNSGGGYLGHTDWRLPNIVEIASLVNIGEPTLNTWLNSQGFVNVQSGIYWSGSTNAGSTIAAGYVDMSSGVVSGNTRTTAYYVWPVRSGSSGSSTLAKTGQTLCYNASGFAVTTTACTGTGQDGELQTGTAWPSPRFSDNSVAAPADLTVTDNVTGLIWTKDANLAAGTKNWQGALDYINSLNTMNSGSGYQGHTDWRLPNVLELSSLVNIGETTLNTWLNGQGFSNVQSGYYWSASTSSVNAINAWSVYLGKPPLTSKGVVYGSSKTGSYSVWPVRGGLGSLDIPVNGVCGSSDGGMFTIAPTTNFCSEGTATAVTGTGPWKWTCQGANNGANVSCMADTDADIPGDLNGDRAITLSDAIIGLQVISGMHPQYLRRDYTTSGADVNDDGKVGMPELLYILQKTAGARE